MAKRSKPEGAQVDAANKMLADTAKAVTEPKANPVADPDVSAEEHTGEAPEPKDEAPATGGPLKFTRVPATERRFAYRFAAKMETKGESLTFTVDRMVTEDEAEASPSSAPLFEGIYVTTWGEGEYLIVPAHFELVEYFRAQEAAGLLKDRVYCVTFLEKVKASKGEVAKYDIAYAARP